MPIRFGNVAALAVVCLAFSSSTATAGVIDDAKDAIRKHLIIPGSAKFSDLHRRGDYVCGKVDAKTIEGKYDGAKLMIYNIGNQLSTIIDGGDISVVATDTIQRDLDHACS